MPGILLFGAEGQVGWELQRSLSVVGTVVPLTRPQVNLKHTWAVRGAIRDCRPDVIVNAAAYTAVDKAESEGDLAFAVNASAPLIMVEEARAAGIPLVHYSTDYAYSGNKPGRYVETDDTDPQSVYGRSKVAGDLALLGAGARVVVLRTSWVYAARGANFVKTILRLAAEREALRVVSDQIGAPTSAELLADVTAHILPRLNERSPGASPRSGLFHCTAAGATSWHGYATFIVTEALKLGAKLKLAPENIEAIATDQYPTPATRPKNSQLDCSKLETTFGLQLPPWQVHVQRTLKELLA